MVSPAAIQARPRTKSWLGYCKERWACCVAHWLSWWGGAKQKATRCSPQMRLPQVMVKLNGQGNQIIETLKVFPSNQLALFGLIQASDEHPTQHLLIPACTCSQDPELQRVIRDGPGVDTTSWSETGQSWRENDSKANQSNSWFEPRAVELFHKKQCITLGRNLCS